MLTSDFMKRIPLSGKAGRGLFLLCDDKDFPLLAKYTWYSRHGYASTVVHVAGAGGKHVPSKKRQRNIIAHNLLMGKKAGYIIDHRNRNRLDCRRRNLRFVTYSVNSQNSTRHRPSSGYWGVTQESPNCFNAKYATECLGFYKTAELAAMARDRRVKELGHCDVDLNFPEVKDYSAVVRQPPRTQQERSSSVVGVSFSHTRKAKGKWRAVKNKKHLGWFLTESEAIAEIERYCHESS